MGNRKIFIDFLPVTAALVLLFLVSHTQKVKKDKSQVLAGLHTLSIHVRDTLTHDSVFHFLADKLKLPVYYYPHMVGPYRYGAVYTGNIVLEPCGPYTSFRYASDDFRAISFGLTFNTAGALTTAADDLLSRGIAFKKGSVYLSLADSLFTGENIHISLRERNPAHREIFDALLDSLGKLHENGPGIQKVKTIRIGYKSPSGLDKWKSLIFPGKIQNRLVYRNGNDPEFIFLRDSIKEVHAIVFKVRSLEQARKFLVKNDLAGKITKETIKLDPSKAFGLDISFEE